MTHPILLVRFSSNSEAKASELLEFFSLITCKMIRFESLNRQSHQLMLFVAKGLIYISLARYYTSFIFQQTPHLPLSPPQSPQKTTTKVDFNPSHVQNFSPDQQYLQYQLNNKDTLLQQKVS